MCTVRGILGHDLRMYRLALGPPGELRVRAVVRGRIGLELRELAEDVRHLPLWLLAFRLMPDETQSYCLLEPDSRNVAQCVVTVRLIGDLPVGAVRPPAPPVEGALDAVADHGAAVADVRAEVLAVGLHDVQLAVSSR